MISWYSYTGADGVSNAILTTISSSEEAIHTGWHLEWNQNIQGPFNCFKSWKAEVNTHTHTETQSNSSYSWLCVSIYDPLEFNILKPNHPVWLLFIYFVCVPFSPWFLISFLLCRSTSSGWAEVLTRKSESERASRKEDCNPNNKKGWRETGNMHGRNQVTAIFNYILE